jgi:hypothetical protein
VLEVEENLLSGAHFVDSLLDEICIGNHSCDGLCCRCNQGQGEISEAALGRFLNWNIHVEPHILVIDVGRRV